MALIYANAVNKRMSHGLSTKQRKKSDCCRACSPCRSPCPYVSQHKCSMEETTRKKSSTADSAISSGDNSTVQDNATSADPVEHRAVVRSKTTCCDLSKIKDNNRKRSTPTFGSNHRSNSRHREELRTELAKKQLIQKYNLESSELPKSSSLDDEEEDSRADESEQGQHRKQHRESAFSRMKRKFSSWKM